MRRIRSQRNGCPGGIPALVGGDQHGSWPPTKLERFFAPIPISRRVYMMQKLRQIEQDILAKGRVDERDLEALRGQGYTGRMVERPEADVLVELHKRVQHRTPAFEKFFYQAIKDHILAHGRLDAEEAAWLRQLLFADGELADE